MKLHTFPTKGIYYKYKSKSGKVTNMHMMYGYCSIWPMILMIVFWAGLISLGVFLMSRFVNGGNRQTPLQILRERLAKGEINENEYERLKTTIKQNKK